MSTSSFIITGGTPLYGSVRIGGAKNASYKVMLAALLAEDTSKLLNFSHISDVDAVARISEYLGAKVTRAGERAIFIDPSSLSKYSISAEDGAQGRFSTMFIPPLVARFGKAVVPAPGGDKIGQRPLERHFEGLKALGINIQVENGMYVAETQGLKGTTYRFEKNTHTGTETLLMAAVLATGTTVLENAAEEPEVDDLIAFLINMGAQIERRGRTITIQGVKKLRGTIHKIMPDRNEAVSYACAALATKGDVIIENARAQDLKSFLNKLDEIGAGYEVGQYGMRFFYKKPLQATDVTTEISPGFMTDWQPLWATLVTQCQGQSVIHETIMESRFQYVPFLQKMGADIEYFQPAVPDPHQTYNFNYEDTDPDQPHAIRITGATELQPITAEVNDLRQGATLILAALTAKGESHIHHIEHVDRGYEELDHRLNSMGAKIKRV